MLSGLYHGLRVVFFALLIPPWCIFMLVVVGVWSILHLPGRERAYLWFHHGCCYLFHLRCHVVGEMCQHRPVLFVANHVSYLDVFVLGRFLPAYFIAKSEVASWPILGQLARVQNTLFFARKGNAARQQIKVMSEHFSSGKNLILFPEGTSSNGEQVLAFKSSLLQAVQGSEQEVMIQPVTIAYTHYKKAPMSASVRDQYAWYGDMPFARHFFNALGLRTADVSLCFHSPVRLSDFDDRKQCAQMCQKHVALGLQQQLVVNDH